MSSVKISVKNITRVLGIGCIENERIGLDSTMYHISDLPHILDKSTKIFLRGESHVENKNPWEK